MLQLIYYLIQALQPILAPLCFIIAWILPIFFLWTLFSAIRETVNRAKQMHQIPCTNCRFFTNNYRLKCTIQPFIANTEEAIGCSDYQLDERYSRSQESGVRSQE